MWNFSTRRVLAKSVRLARSYDYSRQCMKVFAWKCSRSIGAWKRVAWQLPTFSIVLSLSMILFSGAQANVKYRSSTPSLLTSNTSIPFRFPVTSRAVHDRELRKSGQQTLVDENQTDSSWRLASLILLAVLATTSWHHLSVCGLWTTVTCDLKPVTDLKRAWWKQFIAPLSCPVQPSYPVCTTASTHCSHLMFDSATWSKQLGRAPRIG